MQNKISAKKDIDTKLKKTLLFRNYNKRQYEHHKYFNLLCYYLERINRFDLSHSKLINIGT